MIPFVVGLLVGVFGRGLLRLLVLFMVAAFLLMGAMGSGFDGWATVGVTAAVVLFILVASHRRSA